MVYEVSGKLTLEDDRCGIAKITFALLDYVREYESHVEHVNVLVDELRDRAHKCAYVHCPEDVDNTDVILSLVQDRFGTSLGTLPSALEKISQVVSSLYVRDVTAELDLYITPHPDYAKSGFVKSAEMLADYLSNIVFRQPCRLTYRGVEITFRTLYLMIVDVVLKCRHLCNIRISLQDDVVKLQLEVVDDEKFRLFARRFLKNILDPEELLKQAISMFAEFILDRQIAARSDREVTVYVAERVEEMFSHIIDRICSPDNVDVLQRWLRETDLEREVTILLGRGKIALGRDAEVIREVVQAHGLGKIVDHVKSIVKMVQTDNTCIIWHRLD